MGDKLRAGLVAHLTDVAEAAGVSRNTVGKWVRKEGFPEKVDGAYDLWAIATWKATPAAVVELPTDGDLEQALLAGPDSPELERLRRVKRQLAEIDLEERLGTIIQVATVREWLTDMAAILRRAGDQLEKSHGPPARELLNRALDKILEVAENRIGPNESDDASE